MLRTTDPMECLVERALQDAGIRYDTRDPSNLDFYLPDLDIHIEVKQFHSDRISAQMARVPNVIAIQGKGAVETFCRLISK